MRAGRRGFTLIEVVIATTLVALIAVALLTAMHVGFNAMGKSNDKLMHNRRVAGVERAIEQQVEGIIPATATCAGNEPGQPGTRISFFEGEPRAMRFVSSYSLQEGGRGSPRILEYQVIPGAEGIGVRLIVNELLYSGPLSTGMLCTGMGLGADGHPAPMFLKIAVGPGSFVLADKLSGCRFFFREPPPRKDEPPKWVDHWTRPVLPDAIRIDMAPLDPDPSSMQLLPLTIPVHITRDPLETYEP